VTVDPVVPLIVRAGLALLFTTAATHKLRDVPRFRAALADYRLLPGALAAPVALALPAAELAVATALAVSATAHAGLVAAAALLVLYGGAIAVNLGRGRRHIDCGCLGPAARQPIRGGLVARNAVLALAALGALVPVAPRPLGWVDAVSVGGATLALGALAAAYGRLAAVAAREAAA
jgi:hypothetical protein